MRAVFRHAILSWLFAVLVEYTLLPFSLRKLGGLVGASEMSPLRVLLITGFGILALMLLSRHTETAPIERWGILACFSMLALMGLIASFSWSFLAACLMIIAVLLVYCIRGWNDTAEVFKDPPDSKKRWMYITIGAAVGFFLILSVWTVARVFCFLTPTYDFGIFAQMFHQMKETGLPLTTVERDGLLSHFAVHVSPVWYLLLPFYLLVPIPETLQVLQAAVIASAVIPLWKLAKLHGFSGPGRMLLCLILLLYPAFIGGASHDIHENCFLTPFILWLFYGIDKKSTAIIAVSAILTLSVKEDAAMYVAVIALFMIVRALLHQKADSCRQLVTGAILFAAALGYFFLTTTYLANFGDGVMTNRYRNFMYDGSGSLFTVVKAVLIHPLKAVFECADNSKLSFIALTVLPFAALPLLTRRYERYILLIPYVLLNLMSDYVYQHDIFYQYTFGSIAFLVYLLLVNTKEFRTNRLQTASLITAAAIGAGCFGVLIVPRAYRTARLAVNASWQFLAMRETLDLIPKDASVTASTFYTTYLSERDTLYDYGYASEEHLLSSDYIVLSKSTIKDLEDNTHADGGNDYDVLLAMLFLSGYEEYAGMDDVMTIWRRTEPAPESQ